MILERDQWHLGYASLLRDCRGPSPSSSSDDTSSDLPSGDLPSVGRALLLVHPDADAMASARILSYMLRADGVPYQLRPCMGWDGLRQILAKAGAIGPAPKEGDETDEEGDEGEGERHVIEGESDVRAVVLMNMGAGRNLAKLFRGEAGNDVFGSSNGRSPVRCYVMDCHRPYHLGNVHAGKNVVLFNDRPFEDGEVPSDGDDLSGDGGSSDEESDSDSSDDSDDDEGGEGGGGRRGGSDSEGEQEFELGDDEPAKEGDESDDDEDEEDGRRAKRPRRDVDPADDPARDPEQGPPASPAGDAEGDDLQDSDDEDDITKKDNAPNPLDTTAATADLTMNLDDTLDASLLDPSQPPPSQSSASLPLRELRRQRRNRIRLHYAAGSYHASPAAWTAYTLGRQLRFGDTPDLLWLACVGVTDAYVHGRLDLGGYTALTVDLNRHVGRLFPNDLVDRAGRAVYAEDLEGAPDGLGSGGITQLSLSENGRILSNDEYKFMLLRHTSLWDSLLHSSFVASKLQVWKGSGRRKLMELLARMGFPLDRCRQPWAFVGPGTKKRLKGRVEECAEEYGLENVSYSGFVRVTGYRSLLSASDMSYAVTALLECSAAAMDGGKVLSDDDTLDEDEREDREMVEAFNVAFDALNSNGGPSISSAAGGALATMEGGVEGGDLSSLVNGGDMTGTTGLGAGIRLAMTLQRTVMSAARNLIDRNAITRLSHFRYAYLHCSGSGGAGSGGPGSKVVTPDGSNKNGDKSSSRDQFHVFAKPLVLARLARFLADVHRENGKWTGARSRPLVLLAEKPRAGSYVVAGYECPEEAGSVVKNGFGQNFELAARSMRGTFRFDGFDSNVVEVAAKDVQKFLEQLHYMMEQV